MDAKYIFGIAALTVILLGTLFKDRVKATILGFKFFAENRLGKNKLDVKGNGNKSSQGVGRNNRSATENIARMEGDNNINEQG